MPAVESYFAPLHRRPSAPSANISICDITLTSAVTRRRKKFTERVRVDSDSPRLSFEQRNWKRGTHSGPETLNVISGSYGKGAQTGCAQARGERARRQQYPRVPAGANGAQIMQRRCCWHTNQTSTTPQNTEMMCRVWFASS
ncbi:hypothetical protein MHYP_G00314280 [Metynnis hypsauchen]